MRIPAQYHQRTPLRFNITPLIDIVFLLIIFFLVASHFARSENAEAIQLPLATSAASDAEQVPFRLTITIDAKGSFSVAGVELSEEEVLARISQLHADAAAEEAVPEVRIRADRDGHYGPMRTLIEHCSRSNIRSLKFAVMSPEDHSP
ncbi:MAG: biopolymer transporter ExbD [Planctomycetaceae bacterium]|nr:biopolymer transporter ExbD [Planctomycetaceae bacterium]